MYLDVQVAGFIKWFMSVNTVWTTLQ